MACPNDHESKNDLEVKDILSPNCDILEVSKPKPMSPVLGGGSLNRKFLIGRRLKSRKSRVKLSDRFKECETKKESSNSLDIDFTEFSNESFTLSQNENLLNQIEKLEEIENKREKIYNALVSNKKDDFCFKKPTSPALCKVKKLKVEKETDSIDSKCSEENIEISEVEETRKIFLPDCPGFQTATGKVISVLEEDIKRQSKLFEDIICDSSQYCGQRKKKYAFLSKSETGMCVKRDVLDVIKPPCKSDIDIRNSPKVLNSVQTKFECNPFCEGFKSAFDSAVEQFGTAANNMVASDYSDNILREQLKNVQNSGNLFPKSTSTPEEEISLTQEIYNSGISNTQMLCAVDKALNSVECNKNMTKHDFKGFTQQETSDYANIYRRFIDVFIKLLEYNMNNKFNKKGILSPIFSLKAVLQQVAAVNRELSNNVPSNSKKRSSDDLPGDLLSPPKRMKNEREATSNCVSNLDNMSVKFPATFNIPNDRLCRLADENRDSFLKKNVGFGGFSSASGKAIKVSDNSIKKARNIFDDLDLKPFQQNLCPRTENVTSNTANNGAFEGFSSASGKAINLTEGSLKKARKVFDDLGLETFKESLGGTEFIANSILDKCSSNLPNTVAFGGFSSASGKSIKVTENSLRKAESIFENLDLEPFKENLGDLSVTSKQSSDKPHAFWTVSECTATGGATPTATNVRHDFSNTGNSAEAVKGIIRPPNQQPAAANSLISSFQTAGGNSLTISKEILRKAQIDYENEKKERPTEETTPVKDVPRKREEVRHKKRLGVSSCKPIQIPTSKLERAKLLFDEDLPKLSPLRPKQNNVYMSTPIRQNAIDPKPTTPTAQTSCSTPARNDLLKPSPSFSHFWEGASITPIKCEDAEEKKPDPPTVSDSGVVLVSPTKGDLVDWLNKLQEDRQKLEDRLKVILERQMAMESLAKEKSEDEKRPRKGVLYQSKTTNSKISVGCFVDNEKPGDGDTKFDLFSINPQNAEYVHFKDHYSAVITTKDEAIIIPNLNDIIGLSEIEAAFRAMPGVEARLIPAGWVRNHYKWIVWKLASYERMFPLRFGQCLNIENVVQQLKYRYDREIDRAERPALRKIYEMDDVPQKRMVLCVSCIKEVNQNQYELELTDGWYKIRTIMDEPLRNQVSRGKIQIGTKLLLSGAELLNCKGCHPLEVTDFTCLRINYNSTRRTHWDAKLGYQRNPGPFTIPIQFVHPSGGPIGAIKICIVRSYPFKFLERLDGYSVWRNNKAEERRAQLWEDERCKKLEEIQENIINQIGKQNQQSGYDDSRSGNYSPGSLCGRINEDFGRLKGRDVVAILKLLVVDVTSSSDRGYSFFIWRPGEMHLQALREGEVVTVQNILPKKNGDLNSYAKTTFKPEPPVPHVYNDFRRRLTQIAELIQLNFSTNFNEFDTVGLVVHIKVEAGGQEVWLSDASGRLLLVSVYEGPNTCLLLDSLKRGQATSVCNLVYRGVVEGIGRSIANHFTVFSCYSQYRHLQEGLDMFRKQLPREINDLLSGCDRKIEAFKENSSNLSAKSSFSTTFEDSDEDTLVTTRLTKTDVALSLIDMDKFT